jgi:hypothetical protein
MVDPLVQVLGGLAVAVGADVVGAVVVGAVVVGAVVVGAVVTGAVVTGAVVTGAVVVGAVVVGAVVVVAVGAVVGVVVTPLATVKFARRLEVVPPDLNTTRMLCDPSASFVVSYGTADPSAAVPAKSKGGSESVRTGGVVRHRLSR